jgi:hypothetical protein
VFAGTCDPIATTIFFSLFTTHCNAFATYKKLSNEVLTNYTAYTGLSMPLSHRLQLHQRIQGKHQFNFNCMCCPAGHTLAGARKRCHDHRPHSPAMFPFACFLCIHASNCRSSMSARPGTEPASTPSHLSVADTEGPCSDSSCACTQRPRCEDSAVLELHSAVHELHSA